MSYKHLSLEEWNFIEIEQEKGVSQNKIAKLFGWSGRGIFREN